MAIADRAKIDRMAKLKPKEKAFLADQGHAATNAVELTDDAFETLRTVVYAPVTEFRWYQLRVARAALTTGHDIGDGRIEYTYTRS
ncbi:MAG TPA: hypothetical protein VGP24_12935 [Glaciihabitans sp.]|jgi:hypothetical protein|nr:hypothetical protein [Glaciihabitans sp.]